MYGLANSMRPLIPLVLLLSSTILSAQRTADSPQPRLTASAAKSGETSDFELLRLLDIADASRAPSERVPGAEAAPPAALAFRSAKELEAHGPFEFHKKVFVAEIGAYTVSNILDGITTVRGVERGFTESSFPKGAAEFLGRRPGATRYVVTMGAMQVAATFASYRLQHSRSRLLRMIGHGIMAEGIVDHTSGFANNLMLGSRP